MNKISEWTAPDGSVVGFYLQGPVIAAHPVVRVTASTNILGGHLGFVKWNSDNTVWGINVVSREYRGTDLALEMVSAALQVNPEIQGSDDMTCEGAFLARRVNERHGTSFPEEPRVDRASTCARSNCIFH